MRELKLEDMTYVIGGMYYASAEGSEWMDSFIKSISSYNFLEYPVLF